MRLLRSTTRTTMPSKKLKPDPDAEPLQPLRRSSRLGESQAPIFPAPPKCGPSPFFSLPLEIRNMIYSYLVYYPSGLIRYDRRHARAHVKNDLWLVSRQFYHEYTALYYRVNTFKFYSGYVRTGMDPFGPRLDRIERCYLHLSHTRESSNPFIKWFVDEFAAAVAPAKNLKYLILRMAEHQKDCIKLLERISGLRFAQVELGKIYLFGPPLLSRDGVCGHVEYDLQKSGYEQRLERIWMRDGKKKLAEKSLPKPTDTYSTEPPLATNLNGPALQEARKMGGWRWPERFDLFQFLGIRLKLRFFEELSGDCGAGAYDALKKQEDMRNHLAVEEKCHNLTAGFSS
ncbi:MAG: hypothetical protein Q9168_004282 [Polycauliona sp. 1 TL-2023]